MADHAQFLRQLQADNALLQQRFAERAQPKVVWAALRGPQPRVKADDLLLNAARLAAAARSAAQPSPRAVSNADGQAPSGPATAHAQLAVPLPLTAAPGSVVRRRTLQLQARHTERMKHLLRGSSGDAEAPGEYGASGTGIASTPPWQEALGHLE